MCCRNFSIMLGCALLQEPPPVTGFNWNEVWQSLFHTTLRPIDYLLVAILVSLISMWSKARIEESIKRIYAEKLEDYKRELNRRDQAARVAELLALVRAGASSDIAKANQLSWEMSLWLPAETARKLAKYLAKASGAPDHTALLLEIRCILLGLKESDLGRDDIATF
jgi:hypothetical protein